MQGFPETFRALVAGGQGGIGAALVDALGQRGAEVACLGRATTPPLDLEDEATIMEAAACLTADAPFHLIVVATGALAIAGHGPEKRLADIDLAKMARAFAINATGPALLLKHFSGLLPRSGRCVFAVLSARVGSIEDNRLGGWYSYRASKAALNQVLRTAAIEIARSRPEAILLALHPNTVRTPLSAPFTKPDQGISPEQSAISLLDVMSRAAQTGAFLDTEGKPIPW